jgi:hypothetical protein
MQHLIDSGDKETRTVVVIGAPVEPPRINVKKCCVWVEPKSSVGAVTIFGIAKNSKCELLWAKLRIGTAIAGFGIAANTEYQLPDPSDEGGHPEEAEDQTKAEAEKHFRVPAQHKPPSEILTEDVFEPTPLRRTSRSLRG